MQQNLIVLMFPSFNRAHASLHLNGREYFIRCEVLLLPLLSFSLHEAIKLINNESEEIFTITSEARCNSFLGSSQNLYFINAHKFEMKIEIPQEWKSGKASVRIHIDFI